MYFGWGNYAYQAFIAQNMTMLILIIVQIQLNLCDAENWAGNNNI